MSICQVCGGRRTVTHRLLALAMPRTIVSTDPPEISSPANIENLFRTYPCPECGDHAEANKVAILEHFAEVDDHRRELKSDDRANYERYVRHQLAHALVDELLKGDFIRIVERKETGRWGEPVRKLRAVLGAVSSKHVASIEERAKEGRERFAREVMTEAKRLIRLWGIDVGGTTINKEAACGDIEDAFKTVKEKFR